MTFRKNSLPENKEFLNGNVHYKVLIDAKIHHLFYNVLPYLNLDFSDRKHSAFAFLLFKIIINKNKERKRGGRALYVYI